MKTHRACLLFLIGLTSLSGCRQDSTDSRGHAKRDNVPVGETTRECGCPPNFADSATFQTYLRYGPDDDFVPVTVNDVNGKAVFEGDMILGSSAEMKRLARDIQSVGGPEAAMVGIRALNLQNTQRSPNNRAEAARERTLERIESHRAPIQAWAGHRVPFVYSNDIREGSGLRTAIKKAMDDWEAKTGLDFTDKAPADTRFITFIPATGDACYWDFTTNIASLAPECARHEIGHALGLLHEHTRSDRDNVVKIARENIDKRHCSQFRKNTVTSAVCGTYDFTSVMHYDPYAFSCNGKVTIEALNGNRIQYDGYKISAGDIKGVKAVNGLGDCR
jgi:hypothetical protein